MRIIDFITATDFLNPKLVITQEFDHKNIISGKVIVKDANTILISPSPELVTLSELLSILKKCPKKAKLRVRDVEKENYTLPLMSFKISQSELELTYKPLYLLQKDAKKTQ